VWTGLNVISNCCWFAFQIKFSLLLQSQDIAANIRRRHIWQLLQRNCYKLTRTMTVAEVGLPEILYHSELW